MTHSLTQSINFLVQGSVCCEQPLTKKMHYLAKFVKVINSTFLFVAQKNNWKPFFDFSGYLHIRRCAPLIISSPLTTNSISKTESVNLSSLCHSPSLRYLYIAAATACLPLICLFVTVCSPRISKHESLVCTITQKQDRCTYNGSRRWRLTS